MVPGAGKEIKQFGQHAERRSDGNRTNIKGYRKIGYCNKKFKKSERKGHIVRKGQTEREWEEVETLSGTQCADWRPACSFFMGQMSHCVASCRVVCLPLGR